MKNKLQRVSKLNGLFVAMLQLSVVASNITVFIYNKIKKSTVRKKETIMSNQ